MVVAAPKMLTAGWLISHAGHSDYMRSLFLWHRRPCGAWAATRFDAVCLLLPLPLHLCATIVAQIGLSCAGGVL